VFLQRYRASHLSTLSDFEHVSRRKHFLCPEILLPVCVLLSYSILSCQDTRCLMPREQQKTISMLSTVREWTHVLHANTPCSHLHSFCATGVSRGLATMVTLTRVSRGKLSRVHYTWLDPILVSFLYRSTWLRLGCVLNGTPCTCKSYMDKPVIIFVVFWVVQRPFIPKHSIICL
jgi:hypothetical protein